MSAVVTAHRAAYLLWVPTLGNTLIFYNLFVYLAIADVMSRVFFNLQSAGLSLLLTIAVFAASFLLRPLGALVIGRYADRAGRKAGIVLTIWLMSVGSALIAFSPSADTAGPVAAVIVVIGKMLQGFAAGGVFGTAVSFITEHAPRNQRGFLASFQIVGIGVATAFAAGAGYLLNALFMIEEIIAWAWRLPFLAGLLIVPYGLYVIRHSVETPTFTARASAPTPETAGLTPRLWTTIAMAVGLYSVAASTNYLLAVYLPTYAQLELGVSAELSFAGAMLFSLVQIVLPPVSGAFSDQYGRLPIIGAGVAIVGLSTYPAFLWMVASPSGTSLLICIATIAAGVAVLQGAMPVFLADLFPTKVRTTGLALVQNINFTVFGGMSPLVVALLSRETGSKFVPAYYVLATVALSVASLTLLVARERARLCEVRGAGQ